MSPVKVPFCLGQLVEARPEVLQSFKVQCSDRLTQVSVDFRISKVDLLGSVILQNPREDRVVC